MSRSARVTLLASAAFLAGGTLPLAPQEPGAALPDPAEVRPEVLFGLGQSRLQAGDRDAALGFWEQAWVELASRGLHDPRIGVGYIEAVTAAGDSARSGTASEIFLWGLGAPLVEGGRTALEEELDRTLLLVSEDSAEVMESLRESTDERFALELKRFWIERDPTPASDRNERLLEHWERIVHARRNFVYTRRPPLDTDDRGKIYVRYGEADRVRRGSLGASEVELRIRVPRDREARTRIRQYDPNPQYEVWVYEGLNPRGFTYFLFGNRDGTGPFQLVDGVHELISPASRSQSSARFTPGLIPASFYLELFYYRDLSAVGGHFGDRFGELDRLWNEYTYRANPYVSASRKAPSESEIISLTDRYRQEDEFFPPNPPERAVESDFEGRARDEVVGQSIRILSDDGTPLLVLVGAGAPRLGADRRSAYAGRIEVPGTLMRHTLIIRDAHLDEVGRLVQPVTARQGDLSSFVIRHVPEPLHLTLTAQTLVEARGSDTLVVGDRLPGQVHFTPVEPLDPNRNRFELSDVLTGTIPPPGMDLGAFPYALLPTRTLWLQDPLRVYLEFYHMGAGSDGRALLDARFRVVPLDEEGRPDSDRQPVTLAVELTPRVGRPYRESFDMQLRDQEPGRYRLEVEVLDRIRNQRRLRSTELTLIR